MLHPLIPFCTHNHNDSNIVQVYGEATLVFPLLVAETFARNYKEPPVFYCDDANQQQ